MKLRKVFVETLDTKACLRIRPPADDVKIYIRRRGNSFSHIDHALRAPIQKHGGSFWIVRVWDKKITKEEIDEVAIKYLELQKKAETGDQSDKLRFDAYKNICAQKFKSLIVHHTKKYKRFANHIDLEQDGFEALINALGTFKPEKGSFAWWANRYIKTRVQRKANAHSTIKFPIKKAKEVKPYKISTMPVRVAPGLSALEEAERAEGYEHIKNAMEKLTDKQLLVVSMKYGFNGIRERPVGKILEDLSISRQQYSKLLSEAENQIKKHLLRVEQE